MRAGTYIVSGLQFTPPAVILRNGSGDHVNVLATGDNLRALFLMERLLMYARWFICVQQLQVQIIVEDDTREQDIINDYKRAFHRLLRDMLPKVNQPGTRSLGAFKDRQDWCICTDVGLYLVKPDYPSYPTDDSYAIFNTGVGNIIVAHGMHGLAAIQPYPITFRETAQMIANVVMVFTPPVAVKSCHYCNKMNVTARCSRCKIAYYCGAECQKGDFANHRVRCRGGETYLRLIEATLALIHNDDFHVMHCSSCMHVFELFLNTSRQFDPPPSVVYEMTKRLHNEIFQSKITDNLMLDWSRYYRAQMRYCLEKDV